MNSRIRKKKKGWMRFISTPVGFALLIFVCYVYTQVYEKKLFGTSWKFDIYPPPYQEASDSIKTPDEQPMQNRTHKILIWDKIPSWLHPGDIFSSCKFQECFISENRTDNDTSDAVFFYGPTRRGKLPSKDVGQVWIFMCLESPKNTRMFQHLNGKLNWTWSYRRDSDIVGTYGTFRKSNYITANTDISLKNESVAWYVSNCRSKSRRLKYVELMKKYIDVDVYGACGNLTCNSTEEELCRDLLKSSYNFYLSFENSLCRDYVTEKALIRIRDFVVPVVRGGSNYSLYLPPHSYIDTSKYSTTENLSLDLLNIISNQSDYKSFHQWRPFYTLGDFVRLGWCELCKRLHFQDKYKRLYDNFHEWWSGNNETGVCYDAVDLEKYNDDVDEEENGNNNDYDYDEERGHDGHNKVRNDNNEKW